MAMAELVGQKQSEHKIRAAMSMVKRGFRVFLLKDRGDAKTRKRPMNKGWQQEATSDPQAIRAMWTSHPDAGIGISTDGHLVLDLDTKTADTMVLRKRIAEKFGNPMPDTLVLRTGTGGEHWAMLLPPGTPARSIVNAVGLMPGVDCRTDGGYIVGPGTRLEPDADEYRILQDNPVAQAPSAIVAALRRNAMRTVAGTDVEGADSDLAVKAAIYVAQSFPECVDGHRNDACHQYAHVMREYGVSEARAFDILHDHWNSERVHPPLDAVEMRRTINSAYSKTVQATPTGYMLDAITSAVEQGHAAQMAGPDEPAEPSAIIPSSELDALDLSSVKPRDWIVPDVAAAGYVTAVIGQAGVSKSTWTLHLGIAIAANRPNMIQMPGGHEPRIKQSRVLFYNGEDDSDEMRRRLFAGLIANGVALDEVKARIRFASGADDGAEPLLLASAKGDTAEVNEKAIQRLIATAKHHEARVIVLDPLAELHNVVENSNDQVRIVGAALRRVAKACNAAVVFAVHSRKPENTRAVESEAGNMHNMRGASAMGGVIRLAYTVTNMAGEVAAVPVEERSQYVRLTMAKNNLGRMDQSPLWYKRVGVSMGPLGEEFEVGALVPHAFSRIEIEGEAGDEEPFWLLLERIMLANPERFEIGKAYRPTAVLNTTPDVRRSVGKEMEPWMKAGAVQRGEFYDVRGEAFLVGHGWRYGVTLVPRDEEDYLG